MFNERALPAHREARLAHDLEQELDVVAVRGDGALVQEALHRERDRVASPARATARSESSTAISDCSMRWFATSGAGNSVGAMLAAVIGILPSRENVMK